MRKILTTLLIAMTMAVMMPVIFTILMGESPALRRQFIEENATLVKDLDI